MNMTQIRGSLLVTFHFLDNISSIYIHLFATDSFKHHQYQREDFGRRDVPHLVFRLKLLATQYIQILHEIR